jgi:hypothetical protein
MGPSTKIPPLLTCIGSKTLRKSSLYGQLSYNYINNYIPHLITSAFESEQNKDQGFAA